MDNTMIAFGGAIKALADGRLGGYLVVYGDDGHADLEGEFFTPQTDFDFEDGHQVGVYYLHGLDPVLKKRRLGRGMLRHDDVGVWLEAQLDLRDAYEQAVYDLAREGKLGWSSGAAAHLVERQPVGKAQRITRWTIAEASLTPAPAEPRARVVPLKSLARSPTEDHQIEPRRSGRMQPAASRASSPRHLVTRHQKETPMQEQAQTQPGPLDALQAQMAGVGEQLDRVLHYIEDAPSVKGAGYFTVDGGTADRHIKTFGDWLLALVRGDETRLRSVYKSTKALTTESGSGGGYTVPTEFSAQLLQVAAGSSPVLARVRRIPVSAPVGEYPALDQYLTPVAGGGDSATAGGTKASKRAEGAAYTETEPQFEMIRYRITDAASGIVKVTKELRADSITGIEAFLRNVIGVAVASKLEYYILRGSGAGEPLGILNAPALIDLEPDSAGVFAYPDAVEMVSRFKAVGGAPTWVYHPGMINDIAQFEIGTGGAVLVNNLSANMSMSLLGHPLVASEHLPQPDNDGSVALVDLGAYVLFEKGGLYVEFSEHAAFAEGKDTWRFGMRCDGQPWMKSAITLADPQGSYTVSPFVSLNG
ncbi:MAG: phage major capsid protein [Anaerolineae bacterium]|nr:phage major capsid protein [Anaerolineae bacterium]